MSLKNIFPHRKTRDGGLAKNTTQLHGIFALANAFLARGTILNAARPWPSAELTVTDESQPFFICHGIACCLLPVGCWLLPVACCLLPVACCSLPVARCSLLVARCSLLVARCLLGLMGCWAAGGRKVSGRLMVLRNQRGNPICGFGGYLFSDGFGELATASEGGEGAEEEEGEGGGFGDEGEGFA